MTIVNSVTRIKPKVLFDFAIGKSEASEDELLDDCFCDNNSYAEVLAGRKSLVIGEAGSGKTALFRIITNSKRPECFANPLNKRQLLLPICEELSYQLIKSQVLPKIKSTLTDPVTLYRYIWELYILYRTSLVLRDNFSGLPDEVESIIEDVLDAFSAESKKPTVFGLLASNKKTIGLKVEPSAIGVPVPELYFSVEPSDSTATRNEDEYSAFINIDAAKTRINDFLGDNNCVLYVLLDNLDDFVIKEEYELQKQILESLLVCHKNYARASNIKLKLFLRSDLFSRIDKSALGGQKVHSKSVTLVWTPEDIREFLARRLLYNYDRFFQDDHINITFEVDELCMFERRIGVRKNVFHRSIRYLRRKIRRPLLSDSAHYDARTINLTDKFSRDVITFVFPRQVPHLNMDGMEAELDIFEYLSSHFNLAHGNTTPRIMLMFLEEVLSSARGYLRSNPDQANEYIEATEEKEFPLIRKKYVIDGYAALKEKIWDALIDETRSDEWKAFLRVLRRKLTGLTELGFKQIQKLIKIKSEEEAEKFLGYCTHKGLFECLNRGEKREQLLFSVPILFQRHNNQIRPSRGRSR